MVGLRRIGGRKVTAGVMFAAAFASVLAVLEPQAATAQEVTAQEVTAQPDDFGGRWYLERWDVEQIHAQGIDGAGVTVAIIDTPVNVDVPTLADSDIEALGLSACTLDDGGLVPAVNHDLELSQHGTQSASLIVGSGTGYPGQTGVVGIAPGVRLLAYTALSYDDEYIYCDAADVGDQLLRGHEVDAVAVAIDAAVAAGADIISISMSTSEWPDLADALLGAFRAGVIVVAATSNHDSRNDPDEAPASLNGVLSVGSVDEFGQPETDFRGEPIASANIDVAGPGVNIFAQGSQHEGWKGQEPWDGTSEATPIVAGALALAMQKYPEASPNQLLQALIHTTHDGATDEPRLDPQGNYGYGIVDLNALLDSDPSQFPDINPFVELLPRDPNDASKWGPSARDVLGTDAALPEPITSVFVEQEADAPVAAHESHAGWWVVVAGVAAALLLTMMLVVAALLTLMLVLIRKGAKAQAVTSASVAVPPASNRL